MLIPIIDKLNQTHYIDSTKIDYLGSSEGKVTDNEGNMMFFTIAIINGARVNIYLTLDDVIGTLGYIVDKLNGVVQDIN